MYVSCDNLHVDPVTGDIWTGTAPVLAASFDHVADFRKHVPSQVCKTSTSSYDIVMAFVWIKGMQRRLPG